MPLDKTYKEAEHKLEMYIGKHGMRHTVERYEVLRIACTLGNMFTAGQLIDEAQKVFISRATVYNVLRVLVSAQILWCLGQKGRKAEYQLILSGKVTMQIECRNCGRKSYFRDAAIEDALMGRKYNNFVPEHFTIHLYGQCKKCRKLLQTK